MALQCGIVGLPNVGKSTLFNALTKAGIAAENYPFCTIEPNVGIVEVTIRAWASSRISTSLSRSSPRSLNSSTSQACRRRIQGEGLGTIPRNIRETMPSPTSCAASRIRTWCTSRPGRSDFRHRSDSYGAGACDMQSVEKALQRYGKNVRAGEKDAVKLVAILERIEKRSTASIRCLDGPQCGRRGF